MKTIQRYLKMMLVLVAMLMGIQAKAEKQPYVVYSIENKTLTFYYDENMSSNGGIPIDEDYNDLPSWSLNLGTTKVVFDSSFAGYQPTTTRSWFSTNFSSLKEVVGFKYLDTSEVTDMMNMFQGCSSLEELDLSSLKTGNVKRMVGMFWNCTSLKKLNVSKFDTRNVTEMTEMFTNCSQLEELDVSGFNTGNVYSIQEMFSNCANLKRLDLRNFDTSNVNNMCSMFAGCTLLESIDMSKFNTSSLENMDGMFNGCQSLTSLDLSSFDTQNVTNMDHLFFNCNSLETIYAGNKWDTSNVNQTISRDLFSGCYSLVGGKGTAHEWYYDDQIGFARIDGGTEAPGYFTAALQPSISTSINGLKDSVKGQREGWFTIDGQKISGKPTKKGVYIHNGKTVVR